MELSVIKPDKQPETAQEISKKKRKKKSKAPPKVENEPEEVFSLDTELFHNIALTPTQLEELWHAYRKLEGQEGSGITLETFQKAFEIKDKDFAKRLFKTLDTSHNGRLSYQELLGLFAALHVDAPKEEKLKFLIKLYELHEENIDKETFIRLLKDSLRSNNIKVREKHLAGIADIVFEHSEQRNIKELFHQYGITSEHLTLTINGSMQAFLQRCRTLHKLDKNIDDAIASQNTVRSPRSQWWYLNIYKRYHHPTAWIFIIAYILINIGLFLWQWFLTMSWSIFDVLGYSVVFSRSFAGPLLFNCSIVILLASSRFLTFLRKYPILFKLIPFDYNIQAHRVVGWVILFAALGHAGAHYRNFYVLSNTSLEEINKHVTKPWEETKTLPELMFADIPGITGHIMLLYFAIAYPFAVLRKRGYTLQKASPPQGQRQDQVVVQVDLPKVSMRESDFFKKTQSIDRPAANPQYKPASSIQSLFTFFNIFFLTHRLFIVFYVCLILHGFSYYLAGPNFWYWIIAPGLIYFMSWIMSQTATKYRMKLLKGKFYHGGVVMLQFSKPKGFEYFPGQYMYVKCHKLSIFEYHPFSFTSAPAEDHLSVHIAVRGSWTSRLYDLVASTKDKQTLQFSLEGPYGAPAQHFGNYRTVVLFGAGIGVTPFACILRELMAMVSGKSKYPKVERVYFYWIARDHQQFEWFEDLLNKLAANNEKFKVHNYFTQVQSHNDLRSVLLQLASNVTYNEAKRCFITGSRIKTHFGRPDLPQVIKGIADKYSAHKIGVFACGPPAMTNELIVQCSKYPKVRFHMENF